MKKERSFPGITKSNKHFTLTMFSLFSRLTLSSCPSDFQKLPLDKRVSQALNGDLYFSNVLPEDSRPDYICYARFPHTQTIQQKQPISVTVLDSKSRHWVLHSFWLLLQNVLHLLLFHISRCFPTFCNQWDPALLLFQIHVLLIKNCLSLRFIVVLTSCIVRFLSF